VIGAAAPEDPPEDMSGSIERSPLPICLRAFPAPIANTTAPIGSAASTIRIRTVPVSTARSVIQERVIRYSSGAG
jgi:hypothetical protein